jgi:hypothetical protein
MQIGIDSFAAGISDPATGLTLSPVERMHHLLEEIEFADRVGLDVFGIGEHHRAEFLDSAPVVMLSAAAARTENIRLTSRGPGRWPGQSGKELGSRQRCLHPWDEPHVTEVGRRGSGALYNTDH